VDWGAKEFVIGKPSFRIPWTTEKHLVKTSDSDGYTTHWSEPEDLDSIPSYFVDVATQDRVFPHYVPNSSIKHSKSDSKDRSQEIL
jgi:hypothetical protein